MSNSFFSKLSIILFLLFLSVDLSAQDGAYGSYSPYSIFGVGDVVKGGTPYTHSMGSIGIATRNRRFINITNPAAVTARDSLAFMADFGLTQNNKIFKQGNLMSANNTFNIYDIVFSFPIYRSSAFMIGINPYSNIGYDFKSYETNKDVIGNTGNITYDSFGSGGLYEVFLAAGVTFWKRFSIGAQVNYYFGNLDKVTNVDFEDASYRSLNTGYSMSLSGVTGKFGLQYEQKLGGDISMTIGATYKMRTNVHGYVNNFSYATQSSVVDTLATSHIDTLALTNNVKFGDELGIGISVKGGERWSAEINYLRSDWRNSGMDVADGFAANGKRIFTSTVSHSIRAGFEIVPNRNDIRYYFRRCSYRAGVYFDQAYYKLDGNSVNSYGVTFGITLPVFRWYNGISLGMDIGQKASMRNNMISETHVKFVIGFNIHDIWFQKPRYN